uniref:Integrin-linked kinase-associated serine/threonine phosphatase 2C n=1 Tax=Phallusia mammillata TaxID=59560 RepID=A0A6F9DEF2_9ASCI|nr:integrin-linked kinase-associated serine/threonine phosphatase 2C-like [Phallusia mammillata]
MSLFNDLPPPTTSGQEKKLCNSGKATTSSDSNNLTHHHTKIFPDSLPPKLLPGTSQASQVPVSRKRPSTDAGKNVKHEAKQQKLSNVFLATLQSYVAERKGERDDMQDAHVLMDNCTQLFKQLSSKISRVAYFAVFDGHGGSKASKHCAERLHVHLSQKIPKSDVSNFDKEMKRQVLDSFKSIDEEFLKEASTKKPVWKDGTTVCCVLVLDDTLYIANLGDSKAILCRYQAESKKHVSIPLSKEHNPSNYEERQRIQKAGGSVREGRVLGILEVSRSIGDGQYKRCGVINVPDVKRCQLCSNDRFILIACDGLWKVYNPDQAIQFVLAVLQDNSVQPPEDSNKTLENYRFEMACNRLASEAVRKGSADNVTVVLVSVHKL